jgi:putative flippase GtrA
MDQTNSPATRRDYELGVFAGALIGLLLMPILATVKPTLYDTIHLFIIPFFLVASPLGLFIAAAIAKFVPIVWQIAKFVLIGVLNTLVDIGILAALMPFMKDIADIDPQSVILGMGFFTLTFYSLFKAFSFFVANTNSFVWNKYWTFSGATDKKDSTQFMQFFAVSIIGFLINNFIASYVFISIQPIAGMNIAQWGLIGAAFGSIAGLAWNFIGYKLLVFKK